MRKLFYLAGIIGALTLGAAPAVSEETYDGSLSGGLGFGTLGAGIDAGYAISDRWMLRGNANFGSFTMPDVIVAASTVNGFTYDYRADMATVGLLADFYPFGGARGGGLALTAGFYYNGNDFLMTSTPLIGMSVGGTPYAAPDIGTLSADTDFRAFAPYLGIGFDDSIFYGVPVYYYFRAGILFQGNPNITMTASGGGVAADDLAREAKELEDALTLLEYYPVFSTGFMVKF